MLASYTRDEGDGNGAIRATEDRRDEIAAHRASTPAGMDEAWWLPAGTPPPEVVEAILAP